VRKKLFFVFLVLGAFLCFTQSASASTVTFTLDVEFSGATPPAGSPPWLTATFVDVVTGEVTLTMDASGLTGSEFVDDWFFNITDESLLGFLTFNYQGGSSSGPAANTIGQSADSFGEPAKEFDILFDFEQSNNPSLDRFGAGEVVVYQILGTGLTADMFLALNEAGKGPFNSAAHVQGIGPTGDDSGKIGFVPIPGSVLLLAPGLVLLGALRRRFRS
jgi:hypothetical protein